MVRSGLQSALRSSELRALSYPSVDWAQGRGRSPALAHGLRRAGPHEDGEVAAVRLAALSDLRKRPRVYGVVYSRVSRRARRIATGRAARSRGAALSLAPAPRAAHAQG